MLYPFFERTERGEWKIAGVWGVEPLKPARSAWRIF
jgi:hypothetical protein